ncbi:MAG: DUF1800 family protein [Arcicella sp.]|nr:DUF1800 family protein [Arcicella sp.]
MLKTAFKLFTVSLVSTASWAQSITIGQGNLRNATVTSSSNATSGVSTLDGSGFLPNHNAASRFLSQATLGHNITDVTNLTLTGNEQWLNTQLNLPSSFSVRTHVAQMHQAIVDSSNLVVPGSTLQNTFVGDWHFDIAWFHGAQTAPDPLRWRVALALSEILVTSRNSTFKDNPYALGGYFDVMLKGAFGNYRSLIDSVTYQPAMGVYLTFMNNRATDATRQIYPDENYAREIMQLFTVGLYELNLDGTEKKMPTVILYLLTTTLTLPI